MADRCDRIRSNIARLEELIAELRLEMIGATGSLRHGLAGQLSGALKALEHEKAALIRCEKNAPDPPAPKDSVRPDRVPAVLPSMPVSGTYVLEASGGILNALAAAETIRLDVDGTFPQMMASGSYQAVGLSLARPAHWIAYPLRQTGLGTWEGRIMKVWGDGSLIPHTQVTIHVPPTILSVSGPRMTITYSGLPAPVTRQLNFASPYFREVTFEFDTVEGSVGVTAINTCAHAERPPTLRCEPLNFHDVYDRAGVDVSQSPQGGTVPLSGAGLDTAWKDAELDGAMREYWSSYSDAPNWAVWTLFAASHERPTVLGTMFDKYDVNQRQGCAIFNRSITNAIESYPQRDAHVARSKFFGLVHETGHCFNLHHVRDFSVSDEPPLTYPAEAEWPFVDYIPDAATFMNYPERNARFYERFEYRFHDSELKWLRHAPENLVEMGDAIFFGGTAFLTSGEPKGPRPWKLDISVVRPRRLFEFLEPVTLTVTLTNTAQHPQIIDQAVLEDSGNLAVLIGRVEGPLRTWRPFVQHCFLPTPRVLEPGQSLRASFPVGAGLDGWYIAEPGTYILRAALRVPGAVVTARLAPLRVAHPCNWDQEVIAQDFFTRDVGRALAFGVTPSRPTAAQMLREVVEILPDRAVSRHAALALARGTLTSQRVLHTSPGDKRRFELVAADKTAGRKFLAHAILNDPQAAAATLGREELRILSQRYAPYSKSKD